MMVGGHDLVKQTAQIVDTVRLILNRRQPAGGGWAENRGRAAVQASAVDGLGHGRSNVPNVCIPLRL